jgi:hypothetical protein
LLNAGKWLSTIALLRARLTGKCLEDRPDLPAIAEDIRMLSTAVQERMAEVNGLAEGRL